VVVPPSPPTEDPAVVVPPTPKKPVPESAPESVLASGVQRPGETAGEAAQNRQTYEDDATDGSSVTDEDDGEDSHVIDEIEDEEDRLIREGGAGIPVGPVSRCAEMMRIYNAILTGPYRMACLDRFYLR
jgi:carboxy-terminal domain RNA polymerase II polypeptide A small phosphatase